MTIGQKTLTHGEDEIPAILDFSPKLPERIGMKGGEGSRRYLTFSGRSFVSPEDSEQDFVTRILNHPKCPELSEGYRSAFTNAYNLLGEFPFKPRRSGEPYSTHLERAVFYYLELCPNPTIDGMIRALHHDSFEDFPHKHYGLYSVIGATNLRATVGLAKMPPRSLQIAQRAGEFSRVVDTHMRVRESLGTVMPVLIGLEFDNSAMRMGAHNSQHILPFLRTSEILKPIEDTISQSEGTASVPTARDPEFLIMLGNLIQEIMLSGDQEDLIEELCLIIYLSEEASHDDLYVKIAGDRIDNLLDIEFLEKAVGQYNGKNTDKIEKYFKSSYKALATSRAYLFLVRSRLQDPELYGVIAHMMRWSEEKLSTLRAQFESRTHQSKTTPIVIPLAPEFPSQTDLH